MGSQPSPAPIVVFGPFEYSPSSAEFRKYGTRVRLQGQPLRILSMLLDRPGEVVERVAIQRQLWGDAAFGDFEQGLNTAVNKLRQVLGDSAEQPRYIETLTGRGYRFIGPIQPPPQRTILEMAAAPPARRARRHWPLRAVAALILVGAAGYWLGASRSRAVEPAKPLRFAIPAPPGYAFQSAANTQSFALSPDGARLAFTAMDGGGAFSTFVRDFDSLEPRLLADTAGTQTLFWLPDGPSLFLAVRGKLRRAPLEGNSHVVLGESPAILLTGTPLDSERQLLTSRSGSFTLAAAGGAPEPIKDHYLWPQRLPDGAILFTVRDPKLGRYRARIARFGEAAAGTDLVESSSRVLYAASSVNPGSGHLLYVRGGVLLAHPFDLRSRRLTGDAAPVASAVSYFFPGGAADFSVSDTGALAYRPYIARSQLVWVDRQGRQLGAAGPANISVKSARISPDGKKLATAIYNVELGAQELWIFDSATGAGRRLDAEPALRDAPLWSPDSTRLAYLRAVFASGTQLSMRGIAEQATEQAISPPGLQFPTDWSSDGRFIAFANTAFTRFATELQSDIWLLDLGSSAGKTVPLLNTPFHEANATFSPDLKWLAFTSNQSGEAEVYVQAFDRSEPRLTGERFRVSRSGALAIRWRRDGRELFYLGLDSRIHAVPVRMASPPEFGADSPLFEITTDARASIHSTVGFDVSPDGSRFVIPIISSPKIQPSIVVVRNWEAALPAKR